MSRSGEGFPKGTADENSAENRPNGLSERDEKLVDDYNGFHRTVNSMEDLLDSKEDKLEGYQMELDEIDQRIAELEEILKDDDGGQDKDTEFMPPAVIPEQVTDLTKYEAKKKKLEQLKEKAGKSKALKRVLLTAGIIATSLFIGFTAGKKFGDNGLNRPKAQVESSKDDDRETPDLDNLDGIGEQAEKLGIYDGYGEYGMYLSEHKTGKYNFAYAPEVAEATDYDEVEMAKYTAHNQVESFADYLANLPKELQPEGFEGLSILETEKKLESLSDEDFSEMEKTFGDIMDKAFTRRVELNGQYQNAYMKLRDENGDVIHENMEIVECTTTESGTATQFYWLDEDGNEIGSMTIKILYDENGDISGGCNQIVNKIGEKPELYEGMDTVPDDNPTPTPTLSKSEENMVRIDKQILDDIAEDVGTGEVVVEPTVEVKAEDITEKPSAESYQGTSPTIVENQSAPEAAPVDTQAIAPENIYSEDRGGAHDNEYAPVQENQQAQAIADENERTEDNTLHAEDAGSLSVDDLLNAP